MMDVDNELFNFSELMHDRLEEKEEKYGKDKTWKTDTPQSLLNHLREEVDELEEAIKNKPLNSSHRVIQEAVDVANMAMMIVDVCGGLSK